MAPVLVRTRGGGACAVTGGSHAAAVPACTTSTAKPEPRHGWRPMVEGLRADEVGRVAQLGAVGERQPHGVAVGLLRQHRRIARVDVGHGGVGGEPGLVEDADRLGAGHVGDVGHLGVVATTGDDGDDHDDEDDRDGGCRQDGPLRDLALLRRRSGGDGDGRSLP